MNMVMGEQRKEEGRGLRIVEERVLELDVRRERTS
jgi:hypothetical protein